MACSKPQCDAMEVDVDDSIRAIKVVTFNMLAHWLGDTKQYPECIREACDVEHRRGQLFEMLLDWIRQGYIICGQEVSKDWENLVKDICAGEKGCGGIISSCLKDGNEAKMKTAILYPSKRYSCLLSLDKCLMSSLHADAKERNLDTGVKDKRTPIGLATEERGNHLLACAFRDNTTGQKFVMSTYHMPMVVSVQPAMMLHTAELIKQTHEFAKSLQIDRVIVAGDFNNEPWSAAYKMVTEGHPGEEMLAKCLETFPHLTKKHFTIPEEMRMQSAYKLVHGAEPAYTNHAACSWKGGPLKWFTETIDYIFISQRGWCCTHAKQLPTEKPGELYPLPTLENPSDHLPVEAWFLPVPFEGEHPANGVDDHL